MTWGLYTFLNRLSEQHLVITLVSKYQTQKNFSYKKVKIDEPMNSTSGSPKIVALKIWKILLPTAGQTIWLNPQT